MAVLFLLPTYLLHALLSGPPGHPDQVKSFELVVFNRRSQKAFQTTNPFIKWDGRMVGGAKIVGAYIWHAWLSSLPGAPLVRNGTVMQVL